MVDLTPEEISEVSKQAMDRVLNSDRLCSKLQECKRREEQGCSPLAIVLWTLFGLLILGMVISWVSSPRVRQWGATCGMVAKAKAEEAVDGVKATVAGMAARQQGIVCDLERTGLSQKAANGLAEQDKSFRRAAMIAQGHATPDDDDVDPELRAAFAVTAPAGGKRFGLAVKAPAAGGSKRFGLAVKAVQDVSRPVVQSFGGKAATTIGVDQAEFIRPKASTRSTKGTKCANWFNDASNRIDGWTEEFAEDKDIHHGEFPEDNKGHDNKLDVFGNIDQSDHQVQDYCSNL